MPYWFPEAKPEDTITRVTEHSDPLNMNYLRYTGGRP